jgi:Sec-independent protein translocase protein TatA
VIDGLFSTSHLLVLALVIFVVVGPRKITATLRGTADTVQRWADPDDQSEDALLVDAEAPKPRNVFYRLGRRFRRGT